MISTLCRGSLTKYKQHFLVHRLPPSHISQKSTHNASTDRQTDRQTDCGENSGESDEGTRARNNMHYANDSHNNDACGDQYSAHSQENNRTTCIKKCIVTATRNYLSQTNARHGLMARKCRHLDVTAGIFILVSRCFYFRHGETEEPLRRI